MLPRVEYDSCCCRRQDLWQGLGCRIGGVLHKELCEFFMAAFGRTSQWSPPELILGCCVGAMFDKELYKLQMTLNGCHAQASVSFGFTVRASSRSFGWVFIACLRLGVVKLKRPFVGVELELSGISGFSQALRRGYDSRDVRP